MNSFDFMLRSIGKKLDELSVLIIGDSIAFGTSNSTVTIRDSVTLFEYRDSTLSAVTTDLYGANTGGYMVKFSERLNDRTGAVTNVINAASPGSEFSPYLDTNNWSTTGTRYGIMKVQADGFIADTGKPIDIILMCLGINDVRGTTDMATARTDAISLIDRLAIDYPGVHIMISQLGRKSGTYLTDPRWLAGRDIISNGIDGLVELYSHVHLDSDLINDFGEAGTFDSLHLTQPSNNQWGSNRADFYVDNFL